MRMAGMKMAASAPEAPAAEPVTTTEPKEDPVSTLSDDLRSRLGLDETADDVAILRKQFDRRLKIEDFAGEHFGFTDQSLNLSEFV